ncbi:MAG: hypothetical protein ABI330_20440 [Caldimonas sp.]
MELSAAGSDLSEYHLEAAIAAIHASAPRPEATDWAAIVTLYDILLTLRPSPVVALSRAIAVGRKDGPDRGLAEIGAIQGRDRLSAYPFYFATLGDFDFQRGSMDEAREHFEAALALARNPAERRFFARRVDECIARAQTSAI